MSSTTNPKILFIFSDPTQFTPLAGTTAETGFCTPYLALTDNGDGSVQIQGQSSQLTVGGTTYTVYPSHGPAGNPTTLLLAANTTATFSFTVVDGRGNSLAYFLSGLAAQRQTASGTQNAQPPLTVSVDRAGATTLSVTDYNHNSRDESTTYDFWVLVQNTDGDVGLIDPLITNEN